MYCLTLSVSCETVKLSMQASVFCINNCYLCTTLPAELHQPDIELVTFRRLLKTHLFKCDSGA